MKTQREALPGHLYDYPAYYDLVYGSDWRAEFAFLSACFARYAPRLFPAANLLTPGGANSKLRAPKVFEPACGTGRLLYRLAKAGFQVSGLDLSAAEIDYCNRRLARVGPAHGVWVGDMASFRLPRPVDAAFNMINSFRHLLTEDLAAAHLACIAEALRPGGLYVLGLHLTPTEGKAIEEESWSARRGHLAVNTTLWTIDRNPRKRLERCGMLLHVYTPTRWFELRDELHFRTYTAAQLQRLLATAPRLELAAVHDFSYRIDEPIEIEPDTEDVVLVLRKT